MLKEQIVASLKKNEVAHEEFQMGVSFGHFLINRNDLKAVPFEGEQGIEKMCIRDRDVTVFIFRFLQSSLWSALLRYRSGRLPQSSSG